MPVEKREEIWIRYGAEDGDLRMERLGWLMRVSDGAIINFMPDEKGRNAETGELHPVAWHFAQQIDYLDEGPDSQYSRQSEADFARNNSFGEAGFDHTPDDPGEHSLDDWPPDKEDLPF